MPGRVLWPAKSCHRVPHGTDDCQMARSGFAPTKRWAKRHLVDLAQPDHAPAGGQLVAVLNPIMPGLPSDRSVIALWEVDEVARTRSLPALLVPVKAPPIISETCPPGEGTGVGGVADLAFVAWTVSSSCQR